MDTTNKKADPLAHLFSELPVPASAPALVTWTSDRAE